MIADRIDRRLFLQLSAIFGAGVLSAPGVSLAQDGATLRIRVRGDMQKLDPAFLIGNVEEIVNRATLVSLVRLSDMRRGNTVSPWGAETIEQVDATSIAFTLREGMRWTGGFGPVTADDVKFSFERIAAEATGSAWRYQFEKLASVEVLDDRRGVIKLAEPFQPIWYVSLPYYGGAILSRAAMEKAGGTYTTEPPAQCGPYLLDAWEPNQKLTLVANPEWPGEAARFPKVELVVIADDQAAELAFEAGALDYTVVPVSSTKRLLAAPPEGSTVISTTSMRYIWLTINVGNPKLADPRVRQALQLAYDGEAVVQGAFDGLVPRSTGVVPPGTPFTRDANLYPTPDYAKAKALLAEAGASDLRVELAVLNDQTHMTIGQIVQATMAQAGVTVDVKPYDEGAYWVLGDKTQGEGYKTLDMVLMAFAGGIDPSENLVWFRPDQIGIWNWSQFDSAEFEELYGKLLSEGDQTARKAIANRMEDLMEQSGGFVFVCHEPFVAIHRTSFEPEILADGHPNPVGFTKA